MRNLASIFILFVFFLASCSQSSKQDNPVTTKALPAQQDKSIPGAPVFALTAITTNFDQYWEYHTHYVKLYRDFLAFDENASPITKKAFLQQLSTGRFLPFLLKSKNPTSCYKLVEIPATIKEETSAIIADYAKTQLGYFNMEAKPVPDFDFVDINGVRYTSANTKGKIVLFKCWFIGCATCVQEMPELNRIVERYKNRKDILFISLASDKKKPLQDFLVKTKFDYAVVPDQDKYMSGKLNVIAYPTHFLIDKNGILTKIVDTEKEVSEVLETMAVQ